MSFQFKLNRGTSRKKSRKHKKFERTSIKTIDCNHLPIKSRGKYIEYTIKPYLDYKIIHKFLISNINKPIDIVFSNFCFLLRKFKKKYNLKKIFYSYIKESNEFDIVDNILVKNIKQLDSSKFYINYNKKHWNNSIFNSDLSLGPIYIGDYFIIDNNSYKLSPVYIIHEDKWKGYTSKVETVCSKNKLSKDSYNYIIDNFIQVNVVGFGKFYDITRQIDLAGYLLQKPIKYLFITTKISNN